MTKERFLTHVSVGVECWEWIGARKRGQGPAPGYGVIRRKDGKFVGAHRVAYELWIGEIPVKHVVMHTCDNPPCVNPEHLRCGTQTENMKDRDAKGRLKRAIKRIPKKLDADRVRAMRLLMDAGMSQRQAGNRFGCSQVMARLIHKRLSWAHIE